jgi:hypothetical protein
LTWRFLLLVFLGGTPCLADGSKPAAAPSGTAQPLIGAWRLESIELIGPKGPMNDPFYNEGSSGILIYDPSGWMSVQIVGYPRSALEVPASRPWPVDSAEDARRRAAVLDTYYAYFATWEFDAATSSVTHHIVSSLFPGEAGVSYSQQVTVEGDSLIFTTHRDSAGISLLQKKVWRRIKR